MAPKKVKANAPGEASGKDKGGKDKTKPATTPQAAANSPERPPGYIEMKPFQRLPKEILHNHCQKHKMPKPHYEQRKASKGFFSTECILSNPKDGTKTMKFLTNEEFPYKSHSENFSALLALFHLEPTRPYEKLFPSPFKEAWLSLSGEAPQPQQQQQQQQQQGGAGAKRPAAKARAAKGSPNSPPAAEASAGAASVGSAAAAPSSSAATVSASASAAAAAAAAPASAKPQQPLGGPPIPSAGSRPSPAGPSGGTSGRVPAGSPPAESPPAGESPSTAGVAVQISSAHKFASEFERQQAAANERQERLKRQKEMELKRLEEEAQMPTVFMAENVRKTVVSVLKDILPHAAAASPDAAAAVAAAAAVIKGDGRAALIPLQWLNTKWAAAVSWALRKQLNSPRAIGALKKRLTEELAGPLQFEREATFVAVEACIAVLLGRQQQQQQQQQQRRRQEEEETAALQQVLESCQDFIALNTTDEASLPPHFSPAGKQIEIRCQSVSSQQRQQQTQQQQQQQQQEVGSEGAVSAAKEKFLCVLNELTEGFPKVAERETLLQLADALRSLCCSTGLYAVATAALQQNKQQQPQGATAAAGAAAAEAFAAVATAAATVVGTSGASQARDLLQRLGGPELLADSEVLQRVEAIKEQELEAAEGLLPDSTSVRMRLSPQNASPEPPQGAPQGPPTGYYLRVPIDSSTVSCIECCLKSLGLERLHGASQGVPKSGPSPATLHILSPPGAPYPLEAPVVWVSSETPLGASQSDTGVSSYREVVGAILCGAFAAHNSLRLLRPLQQLCDGGNFHGGPLGAPKSSKILSVLSSLTCETSVSDTTALLQATWQFEALLDELLAKDAEGPRGMHARWLAAAVGAPSPAPAAAAAAAEAEVTEVQEEEQGDSTLSPRAIQKFPEAPLSGQGPYMGPSQGDGPRRGGEGISSADIRICKEIVESVKHPASFEAMGLPVRQHFDSIREFMGNPQRQVLVVQGETGSGKTTQLPRMLLEAAAEAVVQQQQQQQQKQQINSSCSKEQFPAYVVCTQPRRLAAVSVASRVAAEMGVPLGGLVGYHVRLQARTSRQTRLLFCTHGVLLRQILTDNALERISVVVVDEVHERCTEVDLLLLVLAKALAVNKHNLKVVVMSASLAVEPFAAYFRPERLLGLRTPVRSSSSSQWLQQQQLWQQQQQLLLESGGQTNNSVMTLKVPGRTFPVSVHFLSEVVQMCDAASLPVSYQGAAATAASVAARHKGGRTPAASKALWKDQQHDSFAAASTPADKPASAAAAAAAAAGEPAMALPQLPQLVAAVVRHVHLTEAPSVASLSPSESKRRPQGGKRRQQQQPQGAETAIIVFCSGIGEVSAVCRALEELQMDLWILPCHASLHPKQQQEVFSAPPSGLRKVVVATNIAETSITISDVGYVIDCGTHKMLRYDPAKRSTKLQEELITRANAQQRAGRAGRVSKGQCFRLYEREEFEAMQPSETPELHRQALDNVCLQLKAIFPDESLHSLFNQCLEPPAQEHVSSSIRHLIHLGALEGPPSSQGERLTSLGLYLSHFPMNIAFAKMLIFAAPLGCLEETVALCSLMGADSDLYVSGADAAAERQKHFARSQSDFVTNLKVFAAWKSAVSLGRRQEETFCTRFGVNANTLRTAEELRRRFARVAKDVGLASLMATETDTPKRHPTPTNSSCSTVATRGGKPEEADSDSGDEKVTLRVDESFLGASAGDPMGGLPVQDGRKTSCKDTVKSIFWYIKACVVGGLYPQVATIQAPRTYITVGSGTMEKAPEAWQIKFFTRVEKDLHTTEEEYLKRSPKQKLQRVFIHPTSVNFKTCEFDTQWVAYLDKVQTSKVFIKDVSTVSVFALLLLSCCELCVSKGTGSLWLDGWLQLKCAGLISSFVKHLKGLFHLFLDEFYSLSIHAINHRGSSNTPHPSGNTPDRLALVLRQQQHQPGTFVFFGTPDAIDRRNKLTTLVKRLVELEGHLI